MPPRLTGQEFVGHVFVVADGRRGAEAYTWIRGFWDALGPAFGIDQPNGAHPSMPPEEMPADDALLAVRRATPGHGQHEAVLRRIDDTVCLSVVRAPPAGGPCWDTLDAEWGAAFPPPPPGLIGSMRILLARPEDPAVPFDPAVLGPAARWALDVPGEWWGSGAVHDAAPFGPFCLWEVSDPGGDRLGRDGRADRRIVVLARHDQDRELSRWTWVDGTRLPRFAHYLLHAATMRYEFRIWSRHGTRALRANTDQAVAPLLRLAGDLAEHGREPRPDEVLSAMLPLVRLQSGELGLVDRASRLRDLSRSVEIASANMGRYGGVSATDGGLFTEDRALADWLIRAVDRDAAVLDGAAERARSVAALGDQLVQRGLTGRQERFNLGLTGVVGAALIALAAIQAFGVQGLLLQRLQLPVVAVLAAGALLVTMVVLRLAGRRRTGPAIALGVSAALFGAAVGWLGASVVATGPLVVGTPLAGAVVGAIVYLLSDRRP